MEDLDSLLARQDRVLSRGQALAHGISPAAWDWRLERGLWQSPVHGVAVTTTGELTARQRVWVALAHAGQPSAVSGDAALHLLGFPIEAPTTIDVVVPHTRRVVDAVLEDKVKVTIRRARQFKKLLDPIGSLPSLTRHATVLHAAAWAATDRAAEWRVAAMVQRRLTAVPLIRDALALLPRLPRRALLLEVLTDVELGAHAGTELAFLAFLRKYGLPLPDHLQLRVRTRGKVAYLDVRYTRQRVTIELDGAHHRDAGTWDADMLRSLRLQVALPGEQLIRLTMGNLRHDGPEVAELLHALLVPGKVLPALAG
jgi:hypothetical protein